MSAESKPSAPATVSDDKRQKLAALLRERAARAQTFPLSSAQERIWFLEAFSPETAAFHMPVVVQLHGTLHLAALQAALGAVVKRQESLRTVFVSQDGQPRAQLLPPSPTPFPLPAEDLTRIPAAERETEAQRQLSLAVQEPFDLARGPLFRARLLKIHADRHLLFLDTHHIVSDAWSLGILVRELTACYQASLEARTPELPPLSTPYSAYAADQQAWLRSEACARQLDWWRARLNPNARLLLPTDAPRAPQLSPAGSRLTDYFAPELTRALRGVARQEGCTLFVVMLALFKTLLFRHTGQADLTVGTLQHGRSRAALEPLIGLFINALALRSTLTPEKPFRTLLSELRELSLEAFGQPELPFERLVEALHPDRTAGQLPIFQVMLIYQNAPMPRLTVPGLVLEGEPLATKTTKHELTLIVTEQADRLRVALEYSTELFQAETIQRLWNRLHRLAWGAVQDLACPLGRLPMLEPFEVKKLLGEFAGPAVAYPEDTCLHTLIEAQVRRSPDAVAVSFEGRRLTYAQLWEQSGQLAQVLVSRGVRLESRVGLCVERSLEQMVALLAILRAGGAYIPLDPSYPADRLSWMLEDAQPQAVLVASQLRRRLPEELPGELCLEEALAEGAPGRTAGAEVIDGKSETSVDAHSQGDGQPPGAARSLPRAAPDGLAYIIFTSGSTGRPKGGMNSHRAICNRLLWMQRTYALTDQDVVLQKTPLGFDVSVWELFWPLLVGARLHVARPEGHKDPSYLTQVIRQERVTTLHFVPSMLAVWLEEPDSYRCSSLKRVISSGEALPQELAARCLQRLPNTDLHNLYGPTEAAVDVTYHPCTSHDLSRAIPIGRPVDNTWLRVLDGELDLCPIGVPGELYIGGVQVGRGYASRPGLTAGRFVPDPFANTPGARLYRTGDVARWRADGELEYLGRADQQVKLRGQRLELGEVEAVLVSHPAIQEAVAAVRELAEGDMRLVAWLVLKPGQPAPGQEALREFLSKTLPEHMIPSAMEILPVMPLGPTGKADRRALVTPRASRRPTEVLAPRTPLEAEVATLFGQVLKVAAPGIQDSFFALGGHSLLATSLLARVRQRFGKDVSLRAFFQTPTVEALARALEEPEQAAEPEKPSFSPFWTQAEVVPWEEEGPRGNPVPAHGAESGGQPVPLDWCVPPPLHPLALTVGEAFRAQALRTPHAIALVFEAESWTYAQLEAQANLLAWQLRALGVTRDVPVALLLPRTSIMLVAILAVIKAGGAYVPLSPSNPTPFLAHILAETKARLVLTLDSLRGQLPVEYRSPVEGGLEGSGPHRWTSSAPEPSAEDFSPLASCPRCACRKSATEGILERRTPRTRVICLEAEDGQVSVDKRDLSTDDAARLGHLRAEERLEPPLEQASADSLAYIIFTSGSTGRPKGVMIPHRAVMNLEAGLRATDFVGAPLEKVSLNAPLTFDASVGQLVQLLSGHTLFLVPEAVRLDVKGLLEFCTRHEIGLLETTPAYLRLLLEEGLGRGPSPRRVVVGGEVLHGSTWDLVVRHPSLQVINVYGPTEATVASSLTEARACADGQRIGRTLPGYQAWVLSPELTLCGVDEAGELYLGGLGLARGYVNRPRLTAERFVPNPFGQAGERLYRSGDRVRWRADGMLEFLGRVDRQVKLRGFRIELGEIEAVLQGLPGVAQAVVALREDEALEKRLVAYVVPTGAESPSAEGLLAALEAQLPPYMVPSALVFMASLPISAHGKVDLKALEAPARSPMPPRGGAPRTPLEQQLASLWRDLLPVSEVGLDDSFFALGGHSLLAIRLASRLERMRAQEVPMGLIFAHPRLGALAQALERLPARSGMTLTPPLLKVPRDGRLPLSLAQQRLWFLHRLDPSSTVYHITAALRLRGPFHPPALAAAIHALARRHESLRTTFAEDGEGPYQRVDALPSVHLDRIDLIEIPAEKRLEAALGLAGEETRRPMSLSAGPLFRAVLLSLEPTDQVLLITVHHVVADGWSVGILVDELSALYAGFARGEGGIVLANLPPLAIQPVDHAVWQRSWLQGARLEAQLDYWRRTLAEVPAGLNLPREGAVSDPLPGQLMPVSLGEARSRRLQAFAQEEGVTPFMLLLAGFSLLLGRYAHQEQILVGTPVAGRIQPELEPMVGMLVNTLVLHTDLRGDPSFRTLLARVKQATLEAFAHQDVPFERLVEELKPPRADGRTPYFQVMLALQNAPGAAPLVRGLRIEPLEIPRHTARFELTLSLTETADGWNGWLEYASGLYPASLVGRLMHQLGLLLEAASQAPERPLSVLAPEACPLPVLGKVRPSRQGVLPLSFAQERLWFLSMLEPESGFYNIPLVLRIRGHLNIGALRQALHWLVQRHEPLRTRLEVHQGVPAQRILLQAELPLREIRLTEEVGGSRPSREAEVRQTVRQALATPLPLGEAPLARALLFRLEATESLLCLVLHHAICDGWSLGILVRELATAYAGFDSGQAPAMPELAVQYADYAVWQRAWLQGAGSKSLEDYWRSALQDAPMVVNLPADRPRPPVLSRRGASLPVCLSPARYQAVKAFGRSREQTPFMVLLTAFAVLLGRYTGMGDLLVGSPVAGRTAVDLEGVIGLFVNTLVLRVRPNAWVSFAQLSAQVRETVLQGLDHQALPFDRLVELLKPPRDTSRDPLVQTLFALQPAPESGLDLPGLSLERYEVEGGTSKLDLSLLLWEEGQGLGGMLEYATDLFDRSRMSRFLGHLDLLLEAVLAGPETPLGELAFLTEVEAAGLPPWGSASAPLRFPASEGALLPLEKRTNRGGPGTPAGDPLEEQVCGLWSAMLGERPGPQDNFFNQGGHSLLAVRLLARAEERFGKRLSLLAFLQEPTPAHMARLLGQGAVATEAWGELLRLAGPETARNLFLVHGGGGSALGYQPLAVALSEMPSGPAVYAFQASETLADCEDSDSERIECKKVSVESLAEHYLELLLQVQPSGPYYLGGWSFGGLVAYELTRRLLARGEKVRLLLLDSFLAAEGQSVSALGILGGFARSLGGLPTAWLEGTDLWKRLEQTPAETARGVLREAVVAAVRAGALPDRGEERQLWQRLALYHTLVRAGLKYRPEPVGESVPALLLRCRSGQDEVGAAWAALLPGSLSVKRVEVDHEGLLEPAELPWLVPWLAEWLAG